MGPQPILETERLMLRPFKLSDAKQVQILAGDKRIASTTMNIPHPYEDGIAEDWIKSHEETFNNGKGIVYAITSKDNGGLIGAISLMNLTDHNSAGLGYWIGVPYWNNGYCTEAGKAVLEYAFQENGLNRVYALFLSRNPASGRVLEKLGMVHEGTLRKHVLKWGVYEDMGYKGILRSEWEKTGAREPVSSP
jgi:ribosomal-protein-alanine N-acetyltransferase